RFLAYPWNWWKRWKPHPERVSRIPRTLSGLGLCWRLNPGVRKQRVPLANFPAPLRGANRGAVTVYFLLFSVAFFGLLVMATDFGRLYLIQGELQTAAEAAALAAATQLTGTAFAVDHA